MPTRRCSRIWRGEGSGRRRWCLRLANSAGPQDQSGRRSRPSSGLLDGPLRRRPDPGRAGRGHVRRDRLRAQGPTRLDGGDRRDRSFKGWGSTRRLELPGPAEPSAQARRSRSRADPGTVLKPRGTPSRLALSSAQLAPASALHGPPENPARLDDGLRSFGARTVTIRRAELGLLPTSARLVGPHARQRFIVEQTRRRRRASPT